ncbi:hypothetical protein PUN28_012392 [Cardiocondyla obscurior]|uniref:Uncharacterized protein n=1 Tax=Cardiocondyla obscurior TaxID=286306 RepID=A0AAW2FBC5_9HYME
MTDASATLSRWITTGWIPEDASRKIICCHIIYDQFRLIKHQLTKVNNVNRKEKNRRKESSLEITKIEMCIGELRAEATVRKRRRPHATV